MIKYLIIILLYSCFSGGNRNYFYYYKEPSSDKVLSTRREANTETRLRFRPFFTQGPGISYLKNSERSHYYNVDLEDLIGHFDYSDPEKNRPSGKELNLSAEVCDSPWNPGRSLVLILLSAPAESDSAEENSPEKNLIFSIDVSGSMSGRNKLELLKKNILELSSKLKRKDSISVIRYSDDAELVLKPTEARNLSEIQRAVHSLNTIGGTNAWPGILLAYSIAEETKKPQTRTDIILGTDGDFGGVNEAEFFRLVEKGKKSGIDLTVLGYEIYPSDFWNKMSSSGIISMKQVRKKSDSRKIIFETAGAVYENPVSEISLDLDFSDSRTKSYYFLGYDKSVSQYQKEFESELPKGGTAVFLLEVESDESANSERLLKTQIQYKNSKLQTEKQEIEIQYLKKSIWESSENMRQAAGAAAFGLTLKNSLEKGKADRYMAVHILESMPNDRAGKRQDFLKAVLRTE
ncbi:MAG TPA: DUF3520 domain-containing protein [Leptospiraceae bacterium]|nr:DUF3520 domain-containing protein [Leptospiraceae bacterium]HMY67202.1 DUF3520 domain-containing protein [Leptospiraceae bacterium]HNF25828.1 DUF3520 domain-containing protein [Leptospiraceae bacterium]HNI95090.1 DUF3520 domain-containing protein [Leptospiraceae bacterium]HNM03771.1 DUF3520 domain-containing protein [Leptospiraceae bacterium]